MRLLDRVSDIDYSLLESDDSVFHYTRVKTAIENIFYEKHLKLNTFSNTNDPLEYSRRFLGVELSANYNSDIANAGWDTKKLLEKIMLENSYFISTCTNTYSNGKIKDDGYLKPRMWSQYGQNHEGLCLVLSKNKITNELNKKYLNSDFYVYDGKIKYFSKIESLYGTTIINANKAFLEGSNLYSMAYIEKYSKKLFFMKQEDYRDENEYRFVIVNKACKDTKSVFIPLESIIKTVIVGDKFHLAYYPCLEKIHKNHKIPFLKLIWRSNRFIMEKIF